MAKLAEINLSQEFRTLIKRLSFTRHLIHKDLKEFAEQIGHSNLILDLGSSENTPYRNVFNAGTFLGIDLYRPSNIKADIEFLPIRAAVANTIIFTEVLEHLPRPLHALKEISRVLQPRGHLIITVPFLWGEHENFDYHRWTEAGLLDLLRIAGFESIQSQRRGGIFSSIGCMISQIPNQLFGNWDSQKSTIVRLVYLLSVPVAILSPWLLRPFDIFDRRKKFVIGYSVLCQVRGK